MKLQSALGALATSARSATGAADLQVTEVGLVDLDLLARQRALAQVSLGRRPCTQLTAALR